MEYVYVFVEVVFEIRMFDPSRFKSVCPAMFEAKTEAFDGVQAKQKQAARLALEALSTVDTWTIPLFKVANAVLPIAAETDP